MSSRSHSHDHPHHQGAQATSEPHDHGHAHSHPHGDGRSRAFEAGTHPGNYREDLPSGFGQGRLLFLDCASGIAGDMTIAALIDLGVPLMVVEAAVSKLSLDGFRLNLRQGRVGAIGASHFEVCVEGGQVERHYEGIRDLIAASDLHSDVRDLALRIFHRLALAEAKVHQISLENVHFHEVGAIDAIVDVVGAAACFVYLGASVLASPLPLGHGFVKCRHGVIPLPAPATVECLKGVPTYCAGIEAETVTPTGAAIIGTVCQQFLRWPAMLPERIGWGAGSNAFPDRPNVLRAVLGTPCECVRPSDEGHAVLEANIDDMTGELSGHVISLLMQSGALDAWATPITMKKGRPGVILSAIVAPHEAQRMSEIMLRETTTLGVRRTVTDRIERPRRMMEVQTRFGAVPVKVAEGPYGPAQFKPEFDACVALAEHHQIPVREIIAEALTQARSQSKSD